MKKIGCRKHRKRDTTLSLQPLLQAEIRSLFSDENGRWPARKSMVNDIDDRTHRNMSWPHDDVRRHRRETTDTFVRGDIGMTRLNNLSISPRRPNTSRPNDGNERPEADQMD